MLDYPEREIASSYVCIIYLHHCVFLAEGRKEFNTMFRTLLKDNSRKPEGFELNDNQLIPSKGVLHAWAYTDDGSWVEWEDTLNQDEAQVYLM
jgi:roadblock/LC7 domain-containing protein